VDCGALREELSGKIAAWLGERELASMRSPQ
jgi:hypothetical protein